MTGVVDSFLTPTYPQSHTHTMQCFKRKKRIHSGRKWLMILSHNHCIFLLPPHTLNVSYFNSLFLDHFFPPTIYFFYYICSVCIKVTLFTIFWVCCSWPCFPDRAMSSIPSIPSIPNRYNYKLKHLPFDIPATQGQLNKS